MPHRLRALAANTTKVSVVNSEDRGDRVDRENHVERRDRHERQRQRRRVRCAARRARRSGRGRRLSKDDDTADNLKIPGGRASHTTPASVPRPSPPALPPTPTDGVSARPLCEPGAEAFRRLARGVQYGVPPAVPGGRIDPPLEDVAWVEQRSSNHSVGLALEFRTYVNEHRAVSYGVEGVGRVHTFQTLTRRRQQIVDRHASSHTDATLPGSQTGFSHFSPWTRRRQPSCRKALASACQEQPTTRVAECRNARLAIVSAGSSALSDLPRSDSGVRSRCCDSSVSAFP